MNPLWAIPFLILALFGISILSEAFEIGDNSHYCEVGEVAVVFPAGPTSKGRWTCLDLNTTIENQIETDTGPMIIYISHSKKNIVHLNISEADEDIYNFTIIPDSKIFPIGGVLQ